MFDFRTMLISLSDMGFMDVIVPFFLIFTIVYSILRKIDMFKKKQDGIIAFVMALATIIPHVTETYPVCWDIIIIINNALPKVSLIVIGIVSFLLLLGMLGVKLDQLQKFTNFAVVVIGLYIVYAFLSTPSECYNFHISSNWIYLLILGLVAGLLWWIFSGSEDQDIY